MTLGDIEAVAERVYRAAGYSLEEQAPPLALAERLLGDGAVRTAQPRAMASRGALVRVGTSWRIYLNASCDPRRKRFVLLHELAHWALPDGSEEQCDRLAGALLMPSRLFLRGVACRSPSALADCFGTSESCTWLRVGEVTGRPVALVTPKSIRLRGCDYPWPTDAQLRCMAKAKPLPGLRRVRLRDSPDRAVFSAG